MSAMTRQYAALLSTLLGAMLCACSAQTPATAGDDASVAPPSPSPDAVADDEDTNHADAASNDAQPAADSSDDAAASPAPSTAVASDQDAPDAGPASAGGAGNWVYDNRDSPQGPTPRATVISASGQERLVFEHPPISGRDAILILPGELSCKAGCKVSASIDGAAAEQIRASRPPSEEIRLSLRKPRELWNALAGANTLVVTYPAANGPVEATFDVSGLDTSRLPGWEQ